MISRRNLVTLSTSFLAIGLLGVGLFSGSCVLASGPQEDR